MAFSIVRTGIGRGYTGNEHYKEFLIDDSSDVSNLPTAEIQPGSRAYSADGTLEYMLSNAGVWTQIGGTEDDTEGGDEGGAEGGE